MTLCVQIITVLAGVLGAMMALKYSVVSRTAADSVFAVPHTSIFLPVALFSSTNQLDRKAHVSRVVSEYEIRAMLAEKPKFHRAHMTLTVMSFIVKDEHLSQEVSYSIIDCLATETSTRPSDWGLYKADQFAAGMIQAEYFTFVNTQIFSRFRAAVTVYALQRQLARCVRTKVPYFAPNADIISGRRVTEVVPTGLRRFWSAPNAWELALIAGHVLVCAALLSVAVQVRKNRISLVSQGYESVIWNNAQFEKGCQDVQQSELKFLADGCSVIVGRHR